jgi:hypothetical protein
LDWSLIKHLSFDLIPFVLVTLDYVITYKYFDSKPMYIQKLNMHQQKKLF